MLIEEALYTYLKGYEGLSALTGDRIYPLLMPQNSTYPGIVYQKISGFHQKSHQGSSGLARTRIQFTCWAKTYAESKNVAEQLRLALEGYRGMMGGESGVNVHAGLLQNDLDHYEPEADAFNVVVDFFFWHKEEKP